ncbi:unnamed protein product, partial [Mesorhabditis belari]|uniref:Uncharacterized protein n=1 Tax=Mesorhabditis belari TaxID=2138241 RepID=A0AAF3EIW2_9BILA
MNSLLICTMLERDRHENRVAVDRMKPTREETPPTKAARELNKFYGNIVATSIGMVSQIHDGQHEDQTEEGRRTLESGSIDSETASPAKPRWINPQIGWTLL